MVINKDGDIYIVKLYKNKMRDIDIYNIEDISALFSDILAKLRIKYKIIGFCVIDVFVNELYGMIVEINNIDKYGSDLDVKIKFHIDTLFMIEVNWYDIDYYEDCYLFDDKYYSTYKDMIDSKVLYRDTYRIIKEGIKIK